MSLRLIQQGTRGLGYDIGPAGADDRWGPRTESALLEVIANDGRPKPVATAPRPSITPGHPRMYQGSARYLIDEIVTHCSATRPTWMASNTFRDRVAEIRSWHVDDNGWRDIGYHWLIDRDGSVLPGRAETVIGAGVEGHNRGVIHICLLGGHGSAKTDRFDRHFTHAQDAALRRLIADISLRTPITRVSGHNEWANKACPGFNVPAWLNEAA